ncbi:unnamed protein product, partial [Rotaria sp. Silwood2]
MAGQQNTEIRDETPTNAMINDYQNQHHFTVTLYESTVNVLRIQLDCAQQSQVNSLDNGCRLVYHVEVWIDLNDDGKFDELENRVLHRLLVPNRESRGIYDLEICIPRIDGINTKAGRHRMHLSLTPSEDYRKTYINADYKETRKYTVNIIPKAICE